MPVLRIGLLLLALRCCTTGGNGVISTPSSWKYADLLGRYRACRCGAEVVPHHEMYSVQCMACAGIRHLDHDDLDPGAPAVPTRAQEQNSYTNPDMFRLGRART